MARASSSSRQPRVSPTAAFHLTASANATPAAPASEADDQGYGKIVYPGVPAESVLTVIETAKALLGERYDSADVEPESGKDTYTVIIYTKPKPKG